MRPSDDRQPPLSEAVVQLAGRKEAKQYAAMKPLRAAPAPANVGARPGDEDPTLLVDEDTAKLLERPGTKPR